MAGNPMQRKARNSFLLGVIVALLIAGIFIVLLYIQLQQVKSEQAAEAASKVKVYTLNQDVKSGQILTEDMFVEKAVSSAAVPTNATSMADVVSSWYLQTIDGKELNRDGEGLYINEVDSIIELYYQDGQYHRISDDETVSLRKEPLMEEVDGETRYLIQGDELEDTDTRVYEDLNTGNCYVYKIENSTLKREYIKLNSVPLLAKVDMNANTVITEEFVVQSDAVTTADMREEEFNMIVLPTDLMTDDYIDIRLMTPNGQNFVVVSKKQIEIPMNSDGTYIPDTVLINLNEEEILAISSAIVEAYGLNGAKLYANKYVEAGMQDAALPTYTPNSAVTALIQSDPNIVDRASKELAARYSEGAKNARNQYLQTEINEEESFDINVQTNMEESITNSEATRKKYLESLGY